MPSSGKAEAQGRSRRRRHFQLLCELILFAMLGAVMFCSKIVMEALPNIHLVGVLTMVYTLVFRAKALIPIYLFVIVNGAFVGFSPWWIPYLYIWTILWGVTMLLPRSLSSRAGAIVYPIVCCLHGLFFGVLYAPVEALLYGMNLQETLLWILRGIPFDLLHFVGNLVGGMLVLPLTMVLRREVRRIYV